MLIKIEELQFPAFRIAFRHIDSVWLARNGCAELFGRPVGPA
jgi:hypothetical protein